jgi:hypothetical protein
MARLVRFALPTSATCSSATMIFAGSAAPGGRDAAGQYKRSTLRFVTLRRHPLFHPERAYPPLCTDVCGSRIDAPTAQIWVFCVSWQR